MNKQLAILSTGLMTCAHGAELQVDIEIPKLDVSGYHRPYVAAWIEKPDHTAAVNLAVWYNTNKKNERGQKWLKDLRQWWRTAGQKTTLPAEGISGPTKPVGNHSVKGNTDQLPPMETGEYILIVESAREHGGRELVKIPFKWDGKTGVTSTQSGSSELGKIQLMITMPDNKGAEEKQTKS